MRGNTFTGLNFPIHWRQKSEVSRPSFIWLRTSLEWSTKMDQKKFWVEWKVDQDWGRGRYFYHVIFGYTQMNMTRVYVSYYLSKPAVLSIWRSKGVRFDPPSSFWGRGTFGGGGTLRGSPERSIARIAWELFESLRPRKNG